MGRKCVQWNVIAVATIFVVVMLSGFQVEAAASYMNFCDFDNYTAAEIGSTSYFGYGGGAGGTISMDTTVNHGNGSGKSIKWQNRAASGKSNKQRIKFFKAFDGLDTTTVGTKYNISLWIKTGTPVNGSATAGNFFISVLHTFDEYTNLFYDATNYKVLCSDTEWTKVTFPYWVTSTQQPLLAITVEQSCMNPYPNLVDVVYIDDLLVSAEGSTIVSPDGKTKTYPFDNDNTPDQAHVEADGGLLASNLSLDATNYYGASGKSLKVSGCTAAGNRVRFSTLLDRMADDNDKKYKISMYVKIDPATTGKTAGVVRPGFEYIQNSFNYGEAYNITNTEWTEVTMITGLHYTTAPYAVNLTVMDEIPPNDFLIDHITITNLGVSSNPNVADAEITFTNGTNTITGIDNNATIVAKATLGNYMRLADQNPMLVAALYDSNSKLKRIAISPESSILADTGDIMPTILTATFNGLMPTAGDYVKAYVWDGINTMVPNTQAVILPATTPIPTPTPTPLAYKVLAIGNSFSEDSSRYIHQIAQADGVDLTIVNLFVGGCSLETHWNNANTDAIAYEYQLNGAASSGMVSIRQALESDDWDFVSLQQRSQDSGRETTYYPYIEDLSRYVKEIEPQAELLIHQTWAYEKGSTHAGFAYYANDQLVMFNTLKSAYDKAAVNVGLLTLSDGTQVSTNKAPLRIIPSGKAMQNARMNSVFDTTYLDGKAIRLNRDGYHASMTYGRYLLSAVWYEAITGRRIANNIYCPAGIAQSELDILKQAVHSAVVEYGWQSQ